jgi:hypothetical protein
MDGPPTIEDFAEVGFNPFTAAKVIGGEGKLTDPFTELARLRAISPIYHGDLKARFGLPTDLTQLGQNHYWIWAIPRRGRCCWRQTAIPPRPI